MANFIDLHNHVLPGLDDGARDIDEGVALVQALADLGFSELHPTPHQKAHEWAPSEAERSQATDELRAALDSVGCPVTLHPAGGENMWDGLFLDRREGAEYPKYVGGKAFLVEFAPQDLPPLLPEMFFRFRLDGYLPVIAHVERYPQLMQNEALLDKLEGKAAFTMNLSTLGGLGGFFARRAARKLLSQQRVHALTTDAHSLVDVKCSEKGLRWLRGEGGDELVEQLLIQGPTQILAGEVPL